MKPIWPLALLVTACGGAGHPPRDDAGDGGQSMAGAAGSGDAEAGDVATGEYWIGVPQDIAGSSVHVRVTSSTEARVWTQLWGEQSYSIERSPGAAVSEERDNSGLVLRGAFVLHELGVGNHPQLARAISIAVSEGDAGHFGTAAKVLYVPRSTSSKFDSFAPTTITGRVRPDSDPTNAALDGASDSLPVAPWSSFSLVTSKPAAEPFSQNIHAMVGNEEADVVWDSGDLTRSTGHFPGWPSLLGATVQFSGDVKSTNGIASPFAGGPALTMLSFGPPRTGTIDLRSPDLETWGSEFREADQVCVNGCLLITSDGGLTLRLPPSSTNLAIRYRTYRDPGGGYPLPPVTPLIAIVATTGSTTETVLPETDPAYSLDYAFVDAVVSLPRSASDFFVTLTVPIGTFSGVSEVTRMTGEWSVYIESINLDPP